MQHRLKTININFLAAYLELQQYWLLMLIVNINNLAAGDLIVCAKQLQLLINRLTPNDPYMSRTEPLTSKRCILYIYSTNVGTEYFKHALYSPFFFLFKMQLVS
jgi:hypothetical protein